MIPSVETVDSGVLDVETLDHPDNLESVDLRVLKDLSVWLACLLKREREEILDHVENKDPLVRKDPEVSQESLVPRDSKELKAQLEAQEPREAELHEDRQAEGPRGPPNAPEGRRKVTGRTSSGVRGVVPPALWATGGLTRFLFPLTQPLLPLRGGVYPYSL